MKKNDNIFAGLPPVAVEYIRLVIKKMGYRRKVRQDVQAELAAHFEDALRDCNNEQEREQKAQKVIDAFGDAGLLAVLLRRAKKRCRPLWRTAIVRCFQAIGLIVLYVFICSTPLFIGKPTIRTSYLDLLNATIQRGSDPCENAQLYYDKAAQLLVEDSARITLLKTKWPGDFNDTERAALVKWLADNKPSLELLRQGIQKPLCWSIYDANLSEAAKQKLEEQNKQIKMVFVTKKSLTSRLVEMGGYDDSAKEAIIFNEMESSSKLRQLVYRMWYQTLYEAYTGDVNAAVADCITLHKFAQQKEGKGLLVEQLVGTAIDGVSTVNAFTIMEKTDVSPDGLLKLQKEFEQSLTLRRPVINFDGEKAAYLDIVQRCFTDDGKGDGRMLGHGLPLMAAGKESFWAKYLTMQFPSRRETLANIEAFYANAESRMKKTPWEMYKGGIVQNRDGVENLNNIVLLGILTPAYDRIGQLSWRLNCHCKAVITMAAILRYKKEKGAYPANLEELVIEKYLKELPIDPFSDKPLVYKKTDGNFILYGVGENFVDDGGEVFRDDKGKLKQFADKGDWVFWPIVK